MTAPISAILNGTRDGFADMPWPEYLAFPAMSGSVLVHGRKSMLHLKYAWDHGFKDTDAMQWGRMMHTLLFEPSEFETRYWPWGDRRQGNQYRAYCSDAEAAGGEVVRAEGQYSVETALEAAQSFLRCERVQALIAAGEREKTILYVENGLQHKARIDFVSTSEHVLTDLKTSRNIQQEIFSADACRLGYDLKLGMYQRALDRLTNDHWPVEIVLLENHPPYDIGWMPMPQPDLDHGVEQAMGIIARLPECIQTDTWPGIANGKPLDFHRPYWAIPDELEEYEG